MSRGAEDVGELDDELARACSGRTRMSVAMELRVLKRKVRVDLALKGLKAGFEQKSLLLFKFELDANGVPDFERDADDHGSARPDAGAQKPVGGVEREELAGHEVGDPLARGLESEDEEQQKDLAVKAGLADVAADPAIDGEVDEGGEEPDFFGVDEAAEAAGEQGDKGVEGQGEELAMKLGGDAEQDGAEQGGPGAKQDAEDHGWSQRQCRQRGSWGR